jgi:hypothetical protein
MKGVFPGLWAEITRPIRGLAPKVRADEGQVGYQGARVHRPEPETERRSWPRLPLAIPVFVRTRGDDGKDFLEFATAMNVSAGGALVVVRRSWPLTARVFLEIPSPPSPVPAFRPKASRVLRARTVRVTHAVGYHLVGLKFFRPLASDSPKERANRRKVASLV